MQVVSPRDRARVSFYTGLGAGCALTFVVLSAINWWSCKRDVDLVRNGAQALPQRSCTDTCKQARDGVCDEGRWEAGSEGWEKSFPLPEVRVLCSLGTDCSDCGAFYGSTHSPAWSNVLPPVSFSVVRGVKMFVKETKTDPPFKFAYTDWEADDDVSKAVHMMDSIEPGIGQVFHDVLSSRCHQRDGSRALVLDVGSNFGYFSLYSAMMGCRVIAWEPVPRFRAFFEHSTALNNLTHLITIRTTAISSDPKGTVLTMKVPTKGNWGTASIGGVNTDYAKEFEWINTMSEAVDDVIQDHVLLMKVDVEGHEVDAVASAAKLFALYGVDNVVLEYNPRRAEMAANLTAQKENLSMIKAFLTSDYNVVHLEASYAKTAWGKKGTVPELRSVTLDNIKYDEEDMRRGCTTEYSVLHQLANKYKTWKYWMSQSCNNRIPVFSHRKSFRASFFANTNIWAQKSQFGNLDAGSVRQATKVVGKMAMQKGTCSPLDLTENSMKDWTSKEYKGLGLATLSCNGTVEVSNQVIWHCPCGDAKVCGEEEKEVMELFHKGAFKHLYEL